MIGTGLVSILVAACLVAECQERSLPFTVQQPQGPAILRPYSSRIHSLLSAGKLYLQDANRLVVEQTGLKGPYDFQFDMGLPGRNEHGADSTAATADSGPTIFGALEQIGLKLGSRKMAVAAIVIERIEPPTVNQPLG